MAYRKLGIMRSLFLNKVLESANLQNLQNFEATENYLNQFLFCYPQVFEGTECGWQFYSLFSKEFFGVTFTIFTL